jgi:hypothetical protein
MAAKLIDTKRQQRILGIDMKPGSVTIDPEQQEAVRQTDQGVVINPNVGKYDVRVVIGASYSTQRSQAQAALAEVMRNNPDMTPAIAPLWAQNLDIPHADKLAQVLTAMAPAPVQAILNPDGEKQPKPEQLIQQVQQAQAALKEAIQHAHDAQADADQAEQELRDKRAELDARERELDIKAYEAETKRLQAMSTAMTPDQIRMMVAETVDTMLSHPDPLPGEASRPLPDMVQQPAAAAAPSDPAMEPDESAAQQPTMNPPSAGFSLPDPQQGA